MKIGAIIIGCIGIAFNASNSNWQGAIWAFNYTLAVIAWSNHA